MRLNQNLHLNIDHTTTKNTKKKKRTILNTTQNQTTFHHIRKLTYQLMKILKVKNAWTMRTNITTWKKLRSSED